MGNNTFNITRHNDVKYIARSNQTTFNNNTISNSPGPSVSPSERSEEEDVQLNQGRIEIEDQGEIAGPFHSDNPTFDPTTTTASFSRLTLQQQSRQRHNDQLFDLVGRLAEKINSLSRGRRIATSDDDGEDNSLPPHNGERGDATIGGSSKNDEEGAASKDEEVGAHRFVDHTYYRHRNGEGFAQRQPLDLSPSKPAYFNIDDQVARSLADSKFSVKRQEYAITVANSFFFRNYSRGA